MANPHIFFNSYLIEERENSVFSFRPVIEKSNDLFKNIIEPAIVSLENLELKINTFTDDKTGREIIDKVHEAINKSRILIFDLSIDDRYSNENHKNVNANVAYELGVARSIREDTDIILLTDSENIEKEIFFDVRGMNILRVNKDFKDINDFGKILKSVYENQKYYQDKRIESISKSIGIEGLELMQIFGRCPNGYTHFYTVNMESRFQISALRLLDLGILRTAWDPPKGEYIPRSYDWTSLGKAVMERIGLKKIELEDFKKLPRYQEYLEMEKVYREIYMKAPN